MDESKSAYNKERYESLKARNMCVHCGRRRAIEGQIYCEDCRDDHNYNQIHQYYGDLEKTQKRNREIQKARYHRLKEQGLCVMCGHEPATHGLKCEKCYWRYKRGCIRRKGNVGGVY